MPTPHPPLLPMTLKRLLLAASAAATLVALAQPKGAGELPARDQAPSTPETALTLDDKALYMEHCAGCHGESGDGKGMLIDFNYDTEPLPGKYPIPGIGPLSLLKETRENHWAKLAFRWMYWNVLLPGRPIPLGSAMSMAGKHPVDA